MLTMYMAGISGAQKTGQSSRTSRPAPPNFTEHGRTGLTMPIAAGWHGPTGELYPIYKRAEKAYLEHLNSKDSNDIKYAYNLNFSSRALIANYHIGSVGGHYGSPNFKLSPNLSHGTHVAGIIAAQRNNGIGIDGIADDVKIMPIVASTALGDERDED